MIDPIDLGATLYVPATRGDLSGIAAGTRHPDLRSAVLCLEDSIRADEVPLGLTRLAAFLRTLVAGDAPRPAVFVRPRNAGMLTHILGLDGIEHVDGFVVPKATADSLPAYLGALAHDHHMLMPTLETRDVFDQAEMRRLRDQLLGIQARILAIRIGGNDLLQIIGARRSVARTLYDGPLGGAIASVISTFAPWGFSLSAPVFENFGDADLLAEEVERDIEHGLLTKTAIHPRQIAPIQAAYAVAGAELAEARAILAQESPAVFASDRTMCEPATHARWASSIVRRAAAFGIKPSDAALATIV